MRTDRNIKSKDARISSSQAVAGEGVPKQVAPAQPILSRIENLLVAFKQLPKNIEGAYLAARAGVLYYVPGLLLIAMGCSIVLAPNLAVGFCAGLVLYMGFVALYFGRRFRELQTKFANVIKQVEARIYIRGQGAGWTDNDMADTQGPDKKTVLH